MRDLKRGHFGLGAGRGVQLYIRGYTREKKDPSTSFITRRKTTHAHKQRQSEEVDS